MGEVVKVLITGGAGYIGSTVASACLDAGITPVVLDNLSTGRREFVADRDFYEGDIADGDLVDRIFREHPDITAAIHCAAVIVVPESVAQPIRYYRENVAKTIDLAEHLERNGCERLLFSSSAAVYGNAPVGQVDESCPPAPGSPYARTKAMMEQVLADISVAGPMRVVSLRYFNPIGADPRMRTGLQNPAPSHALGKIMEAYATGQPFALTGTDWPTRDGSGIRDYIHVWDLADAHVRALVAFDSVLLPAGTHRIIDVGTGTGTTVRELVTAFEKVVGEPLPLTEAPRRPGDTAGSYTSGVLARELLGWEPTLTVEDGIRHALDWRAKFFR
jgi:UDP-glucose 4-epimerase